MQGQVDWEFLICRNGVNRAEALKHIERKPRVLVNQPKRLPKLQYQELKTIIHQCVIDRVGVKGTKELIKSKGLNAGGDRYVMETYRRLALELGINNATCRGRKRVDSEQEKYPYDKQLMVKNIIIDIVNRGLDNSRIFEELEQKGLDKLYTKNYIQGRASEARMLIKRGQVYKERNNKWFSL